MAPHLDDAEYRTTPLKDRLRSLAVFSVELDDFFSARPLDPTAGDNRRSGIQRRVAALVARQQRCWNENLRPALADAGIRLVVESQLTGADRRVVEAFYRHVAYPMLTPQAIDSSHPKSDFRDRAVYLAALLSGRQGLGPERMFAVLELPRALPRIVPLQSAGRNAFILLEDVLAGRLTRLFGGYDVDAHTAFRFTRGLVDEALRSSGPENSSRSTKTRWRRHRRAAVRLEVTLGADRRLVKRLCGLEGIRFSSDSYESPDGDVQEVDRPLDMAALLNLTALAADGALAAPPWLNRFDTNGESARGA